MGRGRTGKGWVGGGEEGWGGEKIWAGKLGRVG